MDNKILIYGAIGLGAYLLLTNKKESSNGGGGGGEKTYTIRAGQYPNVPAGTYKESELAQFGFVEYPKGTGVYYHQTQFVAPPNTDVTSPSWLNYLNTAINLGTTLYTTVTDVASSVKKMKTTSVDWSNNIVVVDLAYGYAVYKGFIDPTSNITKNAATLSIQIKSIGNNKVSVKFVRSEMSSTGVITNKVEKEGIIDFTTKTLTGFDAGSISGVYMAGYCNTCLQPNYDKPVNIMGINGIGAVKKTYNFIKFSDGGYGIIEFDEWYYKKSFPPYKNAIVLALGVSKKEVTRLANEYSKKKDDIDGIGSIYNYSHPKAITHCFDGTYSDAGKGACSYHGGSHEVKLRKGQRLYNGKGNYEHYIPYRKKYKQNWYNSNKDIVKTL